MLYANPTYIRDDIRGDESDGRRTDAYPRKGNYFHKKQKHFNVLMDFFLQTQICFTLMQLPLLLLGCIRMRESAEEGKRERKSDALHPWAHKEMLLRREERGVVRLC